MKPDYKKYQKRYLDLKRKSIMNRFRIIHTTKDFATLEQILLDNKIKQGNQVKHEPGSLSLRNEFIYGQMYFPELENVKPFTKYNIYLDSQILDEYHAEVHIGWSRNLLTTFSPNDTNNKRKRTIEKIVTFLENPVQLPSQIRDFNVMIHEIVFFEPLLIKKYLKAVGCHQCLDSEIKELQTLIRDKYPETELLIGDYLPFKHKL